MIEYLKNNDLVITTKNKKIKILKEISNNKVLLSLKIMTYKEFKNKLFYNYREDAIYYLIKKYNYKYSIAKIYLDNIEFNDELKKELLENNLIKKEYINYNRLVLDNIELEPYIKNKINKEIITIKEEDNNYSHEVYEFKNIEEEVNYICIKIKELLNNIDINNIKLVNVTKEYEIIIKRLFNFYKIPINLNVEKNIYGTYSVKKFIEKLKQTKNIEESLKELKQDEIYNEIINICNKYLFKEIDDTIIYCIEQELKISALKQNKLKNAIEIVDIEDINKDNYYFILSFNQGILPKIYKDEDFISDKTKKSLGLFTSLEKNKQEKQKVINKIKNYKNIILTYKLKTPFQTYYKSSLIDELNLKIIKDTVNNYNNSNIYNKIELVRKLDNLIKYNKKDINLNTLYSNYQDIEYLKYNNNYTKINKEKLNNYINNQVLSYSSIDNYYRCSFKYYLKNILKIDKYEETFMIYIGNLYHFILSKIYTENFNFEEEFNKYIENKTFTHKERFFIEKLKQELINLIDIIKEQDKYIKLDKTVTEKKIELDKKMKFIGIIDKIKYDKDVLTLIDYKTGNVENNLNNIIHGIGMQLPIYVYLVKNSYLKDYKIGGFYLQKIINNKLPYQKEKNIEEEIKKLYKLDGYSIDDIEYLQKIDTSYMDSKIIKGMKVSSKGFYKYTKVLKEKEIDKLLELVDKKINEAIDKIINADFDINPKRIDNYLIGCEYCNYKDICYKKEENIINLESKNITEVLGGDDNA